MARYISLMQVPGDRELAIQRYKEGDSIRTIARMFGVGKETIYNLVKKEGIVRKQNHPGRDASVNTVNKRTQRAIDKGILIRPATCQSCGKSGRIMAHHHDYSHPLHVEFLCAQCHADRHHCIPSIFPDEFSCGC
jgi:predicted Zn-ribbon and HTH transcriptional regulator